MELIGESALSVAQLHAKGFQIGAGGIFNREREQLIFFPTRRAKPPGRDSKQAARFPDSNPSAGAIHDRTARSRTNVELVLGL
jgi:hypothetical protein